MIDKYLILFYYVNFNNLSDGQGRKMERQDLELIEQLMDRDPELKLYVEKHREYERQLETFNRRPYLTTVETIERKRLQKLKLDGRDRIQQSLAQHRQKENLQ